jgi:hypothetical protein
VHRVSRFCSSLIQNEVFPLPVGPATMHVKGCLNFRCAHMKTATYRV